MTSQHLANAYLGQLDRFVKEKLRVKGYVRYMDDMVLWSNDTCELRERKFQMESYLHDRLGLEFKPSPFINKSRHGLSFLGARIFPDHLIPSRSSRVCYRRKIRRLEQACQHSYLTELELQQRVTAMTANLQVAGMSSWRWRRRVVDSHQGE